MMWRRIQLFSANGMFMGTLIGFMHDEAFAVASDKHDNFLQSTDSDS